MANYTRKWPFRGQKNIIQFLSQSLSNERLSHAYLFYGISGSGKEEVARHFIASLLCQQLHQRSIIQPCGRCLSCQQFSRGLHPDFYQLSTTEENKKISIEDIRRLIHQLKVSSFLNSYKIAFIKGAEKMTLEAANALLKILEEPVDKTVIILLCAQINSLPATIKSRVCTLRFLPAATREIYDHLISQGASREEAENLSRLSLGRANLALKWLLDKSLINSQQDQASLFLNLRKKTYQERFKIVSQLVNQKNTVLLLELLESWLRVVRDLFLIKSDQEVLISHHSLRAELQEAAQKYSLTELLALARKLLKTKQFLGSQINPSLALENLVLNI